MKQRAKVAFFDRFAQVVSESGAFVELEKRVEALEEANRTKVSFVRIEPPMYQHCFDVDDLSRGAAAERARILAAIEELPKDSHGNPPLNVSLVLETIRDLK